MEILMKLKCSPAPNGNVSSHPTTLKVLDHHHQLKQHTLLRTPSTHTTSVPPLSVSTAGTPQESLLSRPPSACLDCVTPTMDCCGAAAQRDMLFDLQWRGQRQVAAGTGNGNGSSSNHSQRHAGSSSGAAAYRGGLCDGGFCRVSYESPTPGCCASLKCTVATPPLTPSAAPLNMSTDSPDMSAGPRYEYQEPEENFVSIEDSKIKGLLLKIGREREERESTLRKEKAKRDQERAIKNNKVDAKQMRPQIVYEIIDLDDEEEREKLQRIKNQIVQKRQSEQQQKQQAQSQSESQIPQILASKYPRKTKSPSISLIPRLPEVDVLPSGTTITVTSVIAKPKEKIIARIDLLDSSSESEAEADVEDMSEKNATDDDADANEDDEDDEELPLAAAAVSCELDCEDDEDGEDDFVADDASGNKKDNKYADVVVLASDDENADFIDENEEGLELRWDELEDQKERNYFECFLCGKKVQSSYNLRRHMMIHTGERPFGCDLCDRRFREFSDLKKHRRRHVNEANFVCMVCRVEVPTEQDPTRCSSCDNKAGAIIAATLSQSQVSSSSSSASSTSSSTTTTITTPAQSPAAIVTCVKKPPSRTITPGPSRPSRLSTTSPAPVKTVTPTPATAAATVVITSNSIQTSPPPLTPIASINNNGNNNNNSSNNNNNNSCTTAVVDAQLLLDNIPAVHRPSFNQPGVMTRKEFPCPLCQRPFGTRHNLKRHFMIHTGEKPFNCTKCRKPFREYSTLKKHMITHQRDRWYKCLRCPQKFRDYLDYMTHRETHPKYEDTPLTDGANRAKRLKWGKYNADDSYDSPEEEDSSTEDWLECCECGQRFTELEAYTEHLKQHDPSFCLYECYLCKKDFETHASLVQHMNKAHQSQSESADSKRSESTN